MSGPFADSGPATAEAGFRVVSSRSVMMANRSGRRDSRLSGPKARSPRQDRLRSDVVVDDQRREPVDLARVLPGWRTHRNQALRVDVVHHLTDLQSQVAPPLAEDVIQAGHPDTMAALERPRTEVDPPVR